MDNDTFKQLETLMELDARHDIVLNQLEELDKRIVEAIRTAQEAAHQSDSKDTQTPTQATMSTLVG